MAGCDFFRVCCELLDDAPDVQHHHVLNIFCALLDQLKLRMPLLRVLPPDLYVPLQRILLVVSAPRVTDVELPDRTIIIVNGTMVTFDPPLPPPGRGWNLPMTDSSTSAAPGAPLQNTKQMQYDTSINKSSVHLTPTLPQAEIPITCCHQLIVEIQVR